MALRDVMLSVGLDMSTLKTDLAALPPIIAKQSKAINKAIKSFTPTDVKREQELIKLRQKVDDSYKKGQMTQEEYMKTNRLLGKSEADVLNNIESVATQKTEKVFKQREKLQTQLKKDVISQEEYSKALLKTGASQEQVAASIANINKKTEKLGKTHKKGLRSMLLWGLGWTAIYATLRGVINVITGNIKTISELEDTMSRVETVTRALGNSQEKVMKALKQEVIDYARSSEASFTDVAKSIYYLGSAGLSVEQQIGGLEHVMNLTIGTAGKLEEVAKLVAGSFNVFGKNLEGAVTESAKFKRIADVLAFVYSSQQVELSEMAAAFNVVGSAAGLLDIKFEELVGTIGFLNSGMLKGSRSGTSLMNALVKVSKNADMLTESFGITFDPNKPLNFQQVMVDINKVLGEGQISVKEMRMLMDVFGLRGARAVAAILNRFNEWDSSINKTAKDFEDFSENMKDTMEDDLPSALRVLGNTIQANLIDLLDPAIQKIHEIVKGWNETEQELQKVTTTLKDVEAIQKTLSKGPPIFLEPKKQKEDLRKSFLIPETSFLGDDQGFGGLIPKLTREMELYNTLNELGLKTYIDIVAKKREEIEETKKTISLTRQWNEGVSAILKTEQNLPAAFMETLSLLEKITGESINIESNLGKVIYELVKGTRKATDEASKLSLEEERALKIVEAEGQLALDKVNNLKESDIILRDINFWRERIVMKLADAKEQDIVRAKLSNMMNMSAKEIFELTQMHGVTIKHIIDLEKKRNDLAVALKKEMIDVVNIIETNLALGLKDIILSTGTWGDMIKNIGDQILGLSLEKIVRELVIEPVFDVATTKFQDSVIDFNKGVDKFADETKAFAGTTDEASRAALGDLPGVESKETKSMIDKSIKAMKQTALGKKLKDIGGKAKDVFESLGGAKTLGAASAAYSLAKSKPTALQGVMGGAAAGSMFGAPGAIIGGIAGGIMGLLNRGKETTHEYRQETTKITSKIENSNRELRIVNRNLVALRHSQDAYLRITSFYFRERPGTQVGYQTAPEGSFALSAARAPQPL